MYEARRLSGFLFKILVTRVFLNLMIDRVWTPLLSFLSFYEAVKWRILYLKINLGPWSSLHSFNDTSAFQFFLTLTQKSLSIDNVLQLPPILLNFICCLS